MRVLIVDDHAIVRDGMALILQDAFEIEAILFADESRRALELVKQYDVDLVLLDLSMPGGLDGIETTVQLRKKIPNAKIVIFSMYDELIYQKQAFLAGADGFLVKRLKGEEIIAGLKEILSGKKLFTETFSQQEPFGLPITLREKEVLILTAQGLSQKEIAEKLGISIKTVESHRRSIARKLNIAKKSDWFEVAKKHHTFKLNI